MAYVKGNPQTKKELRAMLTLMAPQVFSVGPFPAKQNGTEYVEGPQYPAPHRWYAEVIVRDGAIVKVVR